MLAVRLRDGRYNNTKEQGWNDVRDFAGNWRDERKRREPYIYTQEEEREEETRLREPYTVGKKKEKKKQDSKSYSSMYH
jgi:hypothetical protein